MSGAKTRLSRAKPGVAMAALGIVLGFANAASAAEPFISGIHPDRRPEGAPTINAPIKDAKWEATYLHGVVQPAPPGLGVKDQGAWYTPFNHRGAPSPYDIRGLWPSSAQGVPATK